MKGIKFPHPHKDSELKLPICSYFFVYTHLSLYSERERIFICDKKVYFARFFITTLCGVQYITPQKSLGRYMFTFIYSILFVFFSSAYAEEKNKKNENVDWLQLAHNYYWFAIEDSGNMELFDRAKTYLAYHLSSQKKFNSIDCGSIMDDNTQSEDAFLEKEKIVTIGPAESYDYLLPALPFLRNPFVALGYNPPRNIPLDVLKKDRDMHALALDICFQEDIAHDTHGAVFPMSRFLEGTLFQDARAYGIYEIIDDPTVMATTSATEKLVEDIERTIPDESNFAVVITSQPKNLAIENESYYIFNGSERFYNYPFAEQNMSMNTLAESLLEKGSWEEQKEILQRLDATSVLWMNILRQETQEGDAFYVHETRILDHSNKEYILKHMGFSLNRTASFWPSILTVGFLYMLAVFGCIALYRYNYFAESFGIVYKKSKAVYVQTLIFVAPLLGFFGYIFLSSFLIPLQPSLENLWFVSLWWPIFSFCAVFITPLIVYWPLKSRLSNLISYNFDNFFPIFSFLAFLGASLHLISNFFFVYEGWGLVGVISSVLLFIFILSTFMHSRKSYAVPTSVVILLVFSFLSVIKVHVSIYMGAVLVLIAVKIFEAAVLRYLEKAEYHIWTEGVWAKEPIPEWTQIVKRISRQIQTQRAANSLSFTIHHQSNAPMLLFFHKLQQRLDMRLENIVHHFVSITENDEDIYSFQKKLCGHSQDFGELLTQGLDEDPIAAQNKIFQTKLESLVTEEERKNKILFLYIENYNYLSKRTEEQFTAFLDAQSERTTPSHIFVVGSKSQDASTTESEDTVKVLSWERIKEISSDYISEEIMEWVEKEAKSEDLTDTIHVQYLLKRIEYLIWYHNKDIRDTAPGVGDPLDFQIKGQSAHITTKTTVQKCEEDYNKMKTSVGLEDMTKAILIYEFFHQSIEKSDVFIPTTKFSSLKDYTQNKVDDEGIVLPYTSLLYIIKKTFRIRGECSIEEVLQSCTKMKDKDAFKKVLSEFQTIQESIKSDTDPYDILSHLTKLFVECITSKDTDSLRTLFIKTAAYYSKLQNKKAIGQIIELGDYLYPDDNLILDLEVQQLIIEINANKIAPNKLRKRELKKLYRLLIEHDQQCIELRTWFYFFNIFVRGADPLNSEKDTATEMSEQEIFVLLKAIYKKHAQNPISLYSNDRSPAYYRYQIEYSHILLEKALTRNSTAEDRSNFIASLEQLLDSIEVEKQSKSEKSEQEELALVTVHIRNKLYRTMMGSKDITSAALIDKTIHLIEDRQKYEKQELDFDYALLRDLYSKDKRYDLAFQYALKALTVTVDSMNRAIAENDVFTRNKEGEMIISTVMRLAGLLIQAKDTLSPTLKEYFLEEPQKYEDMIELLFSNRKQDESTWSNISPKEFILYSCHSICNKKSIGAPFLFSRFFSYQACAYIYLLDMNYEFQLDSDTLAYEIKHKLDDSSWDKKPYFLTPKGIVHFFQDTLSDDFDDAFIRFVDSKIPLKT